MGEGGIPYPSQGNQEGGSSRQAVWVGDLLREALSSTLDYVETALRGAIGPLERCVLSVADFASAQKFR